MRTLPDNRFALDEKRAFTKVDLLVSIAVVGLLAVLRLSAATTARNQDKITQCAGNLRQLGQCLLLYAADNSGNLPSRTAPNGYWPWDVPYSACDAMMKRGATRDTFYDPGFPENNTDVNWNYSPYNYRVTGYAFTFPGAANVATTEQNPSSNPFQPGTGGYTNRPTPASQRVLVADATISDSTNLLARFANIQANGGVFRCAHLDGFVPAGGNVVMLDGHVEWRSFSQMSVRGGPGSAPYCPYWWW